MPLFKKKTKKTEGEKEGRIEDISPDVKKQKNHSKKIDKTDTFEKEQKNVKKKKRLGVRHKKTKEKEITKTENIQEENIENQISNDIEIETDFETMEETTNDIEDEQIIKKKKKKLIKIDLKGKPVYLEDTGEKLGTVFDTIYDKENNIVGYKIKDNKSDSILSFTVEQFDENKDGLIFIPSWYNKAVKTIEKLEFKDRISPELTALLSDDAVSNEELYEIFIKHDDEMAEYIDDAITLNDFLNNRLKALEKQRLALKDDLMDLTEKRLIKDVDRREFSEIVLKHRRKVNILDVNISKCKELISRLQNTSFGILGKNNSFKNIQHNIDNNMAEKIIPHFHKKTETNIYSDTKMEDIYKEKYFTLKEQFQQLEDEYEELKTSVEKLINKNQL